ncbi:MAG: TagF domain-containing protein [Pseudomonadota bacterium]
MLEFMKPDRAWKWTAMGKHPSAPDFFNLGLSGPLSDGFYTWVRNGYGLLDLERGEQKAHFWRFWSRGSKKEELACGLLRDSTDRIGRPYPLLLMGIGLLNGWEEFWDLLPLACEGPWHQMESISNRSFPDLKDVEVALGKMRGPRPDWEELTSAGRATESRLGELCNVREFEGGVSDLRTRGDFFIRLDQNGCEDYLTACSIRHSLLKNRFGYDPKTVFMGGSSTEVYLAVFGRPLAAQDFVRLWSV